MPLRIAVLFVLPFILSGCASSGGVPAPFPQPGASRAVPPHPSPSAADGYAIAGTALALKGTPYRSGGAAVGGFDCSGLVRYVFLQHGVELPRTVDDQFRAGTEVDVRDVRSGDLLFFATKGWGPSHVGIAIGGDQFVHAPNARGEVRVERFSSSYWGRRFVAVRRIL
jgi:cell wall-associated NlpC family hydrolase